MKRIRTIVLISLFILVVFGSFISDASAKFILGKALCNPSPEAIREARTYNAFTIGEKIDLSPTVGMTKARHIEKTVGKVHGETVIKAGFKFEPYIKLRGEKSVAGKNFEESYPRSFNNQKIKLGTMELRAENTAVLGKSHDSADLLFYDKKTNAGTDYINVAQQLSLIDLDDYKKLLRKYSNAKTRFEMDKR